MDSVLTRQKRPNPIHRSVTWRNGSIRQRMVQVLPGKVTWNLKMVEKEIHFGKPSFSGSMLVFGIFGGSVGVIFSKWPNISWNSWEIAPKRIQMTPGNEIFIELAAHPDAKNCHFLQPISFFLEPRSPRSPPWVGRFGRMAPSLLWAIVTWRFWSGELPQNPGTRKKWPQNCWYIFKTRARNPFFFDLGCVLSCCFLGLNLQVPCRCSETSPTSKRKDDPSQMVGLNVQLSSITRLCWKVGDSIRNVNGGRLVASPL